MPPWALRITDTENYIKYSSHLPLRRSHIPCRGVVRCRATRRARRSLHNQIHLSIDTIGRESTLTQLSTKRERDLGATLYFVCDCHIIRIGVGEDDVSILLDTRLLVTHNHTTDYLLITIVDSCTPHRHGSCRNQQKKHKEVKTGHRSKTRPPAPNRNYRC